MALCSRVEREHLDLSKTCPFEDGQVHLRGLVAVRAIVEDEIVFVSAMEEPMLNLSKRRNELGHMRPVKSPSGPVGATAVYGVS